MSDSFTKAPADLREKLRSAAAMLGFFRLRSRSWWIAGAYGLFATLWIYYSDHALELLVDDRELMIRLSVYKGLCFVVVTMLLLLALIGRAYGRIEDGYAAMQAHEAEIGRLSRLYAALSQVNQAIVWTHERQALLQKICAVLVEHGGFRMAWIGWADREAGLLLPVAECGDENGYLKNIRIRLDDSPEGRGPSGTAFREARPFLCNDLLNDPAALPWREEAGRRGLRASAVFPIRQKGEVCGTLNVYAGEAGFFQDKETALLDEAAYDLSYALDNLLREEERRQAEERLRAERLFSDTMIDSMPGVLYFCDMSGRFLRWNRNLEALSGYSAQEIAGMQPLDFFAEEHKELVGRRIAEVFETGESSVEAPFLTKDGVSMPFFFTGRRVVFDGKTCLVGAGIDISERRQAELALKKSEQRLRSTLDNILEGCQLLGFDWRYLYLNDAAARHNRRPNQELLGNCMQDMWPGIEGTRIFSLVRRCLEQREPFHEETEFTYPDGQVGWFDVRGQPVPEGVFVLSIDISERHQAEAALRELNESLERKVGERTTELQAALVRAESADRLKSAFLATMSHELRTPLNSIIGFTGILLQGLAGELNPEQNKQLGMVRSSARHLLELINDVLDLSKIEAGQLEVKSAPFDLRASLERVLEVVHPLAERKRLFLRADIAPEVGRMTGDQRRVDQVLLNLMNNAIKFTEAGGVTLTAGLQEDFNAGPCVCIRVTDTGIGIRPEDMNSLFLPFRQIDSGLTRSHEGTGLGLAICRRLTQLMGGSISAASQHGVGSTFTVILPLQPPASTASP